MSAVPLSMGTAAAAVAASGSTAPVRVDGAEGPDPWLVQETRQEIRTLVHEIAQLAQTEISPQEFFRGFLTRIAAAMASVGGAVWRTEVGKPIEPIYQINLAATGLEADAEAKRHHAAIVQKVAATGQALLAPPHSGAATGEVTNPTEYLLVLAPLWLEQKVVGVAIVAQRPGGGPATQRGYARFLSQMCDLAGDYLKNQRLRELAERQELWQQLEGFLQAIHGSLNLRDTSYAIVNEGRRLIGCDRVSLAIGNGSGCRIAAVSALDSIDRRASEVRRLKLLARAVLKTGEPLWHTGPGADTPPQIDAQLQPYLDLSHARLLAVLPLLPPARTGPEQRAGRRRIVGALIVEQLSDNRASESLRSRANLVARHSAGALAHAVEYQCLFLLPLWKFLGRLTWFLRGTPLVWTFLVVALLAAGVAALAVVPADFNVAARGKLQPTQRRDVFARIDGEVLNVPVRHGDVVQPGDMLAELSSAELDEELQQLIGRQRTNQEQVSATNKRLLDSSRGSGSRLTPADESRLAGELLELKQEAENIRRELELFYERQQRLKVVAAEAGQVVTWKVEEQLLRRPVVRGQVLMTIANPEGPWELELYLPERRLKHVLAELNRKPQESRRPLDVVFTLASHPGAEFHGELIELEQSAEVRGEEGNSVLLRVAVRKEELPHLHDQTTVTARLHCGRRSVGYVWFCDLIETVQSNVLFWF